MAHLIKEQFTGSRPTAVAILATHSPLVVAEPLQSSSGKTIVTENLPGASDNLGIQRVARAAPNGAAVLFIPQGNITINATLLPNLPFNWERHFKPVTLPAYAANVLVVNSSVRAQNVAELIAYAKANPGKLAYASPGNGDLPLTTDCFSVPPAAPHGQTPKLGTLHPSLVRAVG